MSEESKEVSMRLVERAEEIATRAHQGQTRWNGDPYITHPQRVADKAIMLGPSYVATAWLHDVIEDTDVTLLDLAVLPYNIVKAVEVLTKPPTMEYSQYIERVSENKLASKIKILDLRDNMKDLDPDTPRYTKYRLALMLLEVQHD